MLCILNIAQLKQTSFCYNLQVCMRYVRSLLTSRVPCFRVLLTAMKEKKLYGYVQKISTIEGVKFRNFAVPCHESDVLTREFSGMSLT